MTAIDYPKLESEVAEGKSALERMNRGEAKGKAEYGAVEQMGKGLEAACQTILRSNGRGEGETYPGEPGVTEYPESKLYDRAWNLANYLMNSIGEDDIGKNVGGVIGIITGTNGIGPLKSIITEILERPTRKTADGAAPGKFIFDKKPEGGSDHELLVQIAADVAAIKQHLQIK